MDASPVSIKITLYTGLFSCLFITLLFATNILDRRTTVVFCDVGQGDGIYMRIQNKIDVVIDGGPDSSIIECLGRYMPFFDRTIELAFITHPQKDHYFGLLSIGKRYAIKNVFMNPLDSENESFKELKEIFENTHTTVFFPYEGSSIEVLRTKFDFFWPAKKFLTANLSSQTSVFSYQNDNNEQNSSLTTFMSRSSLDPNLFSLIFTFQEKNALFLFTGDATEEVLNKLLGKPELKSTIFKVPHHGSKNGLNEEFLRLADPVVSVISVGRNNRYGHPSKEILSLFESMRKNYLRTDIEGSIVFKISDDFIERVN